MRQIGRTALFATMLVAMPVADLHAESSKLGALFNQVNPAPVREPGVSIIGWIEREGANSLVRVSLTPQNGARLVADPGVTIRPIDERLGVWRETTEVAHQLAGVSYFNSPPTIDVGYVLEDGEPIHADVNYAYCLVDDICLFGEERIEILTQLN